MIIPPSPLFTGDIAKEDEYLLFLVNDIEDQDSAAHIIDDLMNDYPMPELTGISYEATYDFA